MQFFSQSKTTFLSARSLWPLCIVTIFMGLCAIGVFAIMFYPAQERVHLATIHYQAAAETQKKTTRAQETQAILAQTWKALPAYREFTDLSLEIADLAKRNHVRVPGMGYDFKPLSHQLAAKGTFAFQAEGEYEAIRKFIYELEKRWPYLFIEKLSMESSKKKQAGVLFKLNVSTFLKDYPQTPKKAKAL